MPSKYDRARVVIKQSSLYCPEDYQYILHKVTLHRSIDNVLKKEVVTLAALKNIQQNIDDLKRFIEFHKLKITVEEILDQEFVDEQ